MLATCLLAGAVGFGMGVDADAFSLLRSMIGAWAHESAAPDGGVFRVRNVVEAGPDGHGLLARGWLGDADAMHEHALTLIWRSASGETLFRNVNERGDVASGAIRLTAPETVTWDWNVAGRDGGAQRFRVVMAFDGEDAYRYRLSELAGGETRLLVDADFRRVPDAAADDEAWSSYLAHVAAAESALRLDDVASARRWLDAAPRAARGWEWRYLHARSDASLAVQRAPRVFRLAFSADGARLAVAPEGGPAAVRDARTGETLLELAGHGGDVYSAAFSPDGRLIATASGDGTARLWEAATGEPVMMLREHDRPISSIAFSPDGARVAASSFEYRQRRGAGVVTVHDAGSGAELLRLEAGGRPLSMVAFGPGGRRLAAASWDGTVRVWDAETGQRLHELPAPGDGRAVDCIAFSPGASVLAAGGKDRVLRSWDLETGAPAHEFHGHDGWIASAAFSPGGDLIATGSFDGTVRLWDAATGRALALLRGHTGAVKSVAFVPESDRLASGGADGTIRFWSAEPADYARHVLEHPPGGAWAVAWSPAGRLLASAGEADVRLWDPITGGLLAVLTGHNGPVVAAAFSPDGTRLVTGSHDLTVRVWDMATGRELHALFPRGTTVTAVAFSADGRTVASAGGGLLRLFDARSGERIEPPRGRCASLAPRRAADPVAWAESEDGLVLWNALGGEPLVTLPRGARDLAFSPDGRLIAGGSADGVVELWDAATGAPVATLHGHRGGVRSIAFLPDGSRVATASRDGTVGIWDPSTGARTATLHGSGARVYAAAFSPDGARLAWCPLDGTIMIADMLPLRRRLPQRDRALALEREMEPYVDRLLMEPGGEGLDVVGRLRKDRGLTLAQRRAALNVLLRRSEGF